MRVGAWRDRKCYILNITLMQYDDGPTDYIRTGHCTVFVPGHLSYFTIMVFSALILLVAGFKGASAQTPGQPVTNPIKADSAVMSTETNTQHNSSSTAGEQQESQSGQAPQPEAKTETPEMPQQEIDPCSTAEVAGETWLDQTHDFVHKNLCEPAVWFDSFFGEDRVLEDIRPGVFVSLRNSARWTEGQNVDYIRDFSLRWRLPKLEKLLKKARFFIVSGSDADKFTTRPGQPVNPGVDPATGIRKPTAGVRVDFFTWLRSLVSIDAGIIIHLPLDPFIRMRYQYTKPFGEVYLIRFTETALRRYTEHFNETSQLDLERKITPFTLLRWSNYATYTGGTAGITWNTGISLITQLTPRSAISFDTSMWGVNHPDWTIQNYRVGSRYRRNFFRPWLFFEFEPEVTWPKDASGHTNSLSAVMATLEIQFGK